MIVAVAVLVAFALLLGLLGLGRLRRPEPPALAERLGWAPVSQGHAARHGPRRRLPRPSLPWLLAAAAGGTAGYMLGLLVLGDNLLSGIAGLVGFVLAPGAWQGWQRTRRRRATVLQLERTLSHLSATLRANASIVQALQQVAAETPPPLGDELRLCVDLVRSGHSLEHALLRVRERVEAPEFDLVAVATEISAELGANLAATYDQVNETLRERRNFRGAVEAVTAQGRYGAVVVTLIPFVLLGFLRAVNPGYLTPLLATAGGRILVVVCGGMMLTGWLIISRIVDVKLE